MSTSLSSKLAEILAKKKLAASISSTLPTTQNLSIPSNDSTTGIDRSSGKSIVYNSEQQEFISLMSSGVSAVLIGAAGSGKTTCQRGGISSLIANGVAGTLDKGDHKHLVSGTPGIVICAYTRRAVANIRKAVSEDMKSNCLTIHKLLEYQPEKLDVEDPVTGEWKTSQVFLPSRDQYNPLPASIHTVIIEEASMVSTELFSELQSALPHNPQYIFLGDIQQLPPVFGSAILGYKMLELPVIELTQIYRQALESPIIRLAHRILSGKPIPFTEYSDWKVPSQLTLHPWKKELSAENALNTLAKFVITAEENGLYSSDEDMILMPFNKSCGTIELNKNIANHLANKRSSPVYEVIAGWEKSYWSVGDKVLVDKEDGIITEIFRNPAYTGASPQPESIHLDYWGYNSQTGGDSTHRLLDADPLDDMDFILAQSVSGSSDDSGETKKQASHIIKVKLLESERETELKSAGDINGMLHAFALTVHKSQGSEFRKVFLLLHKSHATMLSRELLYTAVTRAKEELYVICEPTTFTSAINYQRIKGNTLAEKAEWFKGKISKS